MADFLNVLSVDLVGTWEVAAHPSPLQVVDQVTSSTAGRRSLVGSTAQGPTGCRCWLLRSFDRRQESGFFTYMKSHEQTVSVHIKWVWHIHHHHSDWLFLFLSISNTHKHDILCISDINRKGWPSLTTNEHKTRLSVKCPSIQEK